MCQVYCILTSVPYTFWSYYDLVWIFSADLSCSSFVFSSLLPHFLLNESIKHLNLDTVFSVLEFPLILLKKYLPVFQISILVIYFLVHVNQLFKNSLLDLFWFCFYCLLFSLGVGYLILSPGMPSKFHRIPAIMHEKSVELTWDSGMQLSSGRNLGFGRIIMNQSGIELNWSCVFSLCGSW